MNSDIMAADILINKDTGEQYRVLEIFEGYISCCKLQTSELYILSLRTKDITDGMSNGIYSIKHEKETVFDADSYFNAEGQDDDRKRARYEMYKDICTTIYDEYRYKLSEMMRKTSKPIVKQMLEKYGISRQLFWKVFIRYLQSGRKDSALTDQRNNGHYVADRSKPAGRKPVYGRQGTEPYLLTEKDTKIFHKYFKKYMNSQVKTQKDAYHDMVDEEYSSKAKSLDQDGNETVGRVPLPPGERPSFRQFSYYISTHSTKQKRTEAKLSASAVRNNMRPFTGTVMEGVRGPGHYVEMDAQEMDIALVSDEYRNIPVGRPIIYVMIDVMSEIILGVSLAMDNNSIVGCTNCFMNLVEDKTALLKKYGVDVQFHENVTIDKVWPTGYKPRILKFDNGSDFISKPVARMLGELNIRAEFVSPATGSLKPLVENFFGLIKKDLDDLLEHKGLIRQTYGSKHHEQACLTFNDAYRIVLNEVIYHNTHVITTYPKSAEMKNRAVIASPMNLWAYGMDFMVPAARFISRDDMLYHILLPCKDATVSRNGILRKGLPYFNASDDELQDLMFRQGTKRAKFECRYDPRDMGHLYYLRNGELMSAALPSGDFRYSSYCFMSEKRFDELESLTKEQAKLEEEINVQARINKRRANKAIIDEAAKEHREKNDIKGMRQARKEEKEYISGQNSVAARFDTSEDAVTVRHVGADENNIDENHAQLSGDEGVSAGNKIAQVPNAEKKADITKSDGSEESEEAIWRRMTPEERQKKNMEDIMKLDWEYYYGVPWEEWHK